jgi:hypothetical protein
MTLPGATDCASATGVQDKTSHASNNMPSRTVPDPGPHSGW